MLRYASADVLLVQEGEPGEGCHGCDALLSAYVIQRIGGGLKTVAKFHEFTQVGTSAPSRTYGLSRSPATTRSRSRAAGRPRAIRRLISTSSPSTPARSSISRRTRRSSSAPMTSARREFKQGDRRWGKLVFRSHRQEGARRRLQDRSQGRDARRAARLAVAGRQTRAFAWARAARGDRGERGIGSSKAGMAPWSLP